MSICAAKVFLRWVSSALLIWASTFFNWSFEFVGLKAAIPMILPSTLAISSRRSSVASLSVWMFLSVIVWSIAGFEFVASFFNSFLTAIQPTVAFAVFPCGRTSVNGSRSGRNDCVDPRIGQLMVPTVFIGSPNGVSLHFLDHTPSAPIEGDLIAAFVFLSHGGIIADHPLNASPKWPFYPFFLSRKSLSINELRSGASPAAVSR